MKANQKSKTKLSTKPVAKAKGTKSSSPSGRPTKKKTTGRLSFDIIVRTALMLIEQESLENFSMRSLANQLKIEPMSLYHYFPSRLDLLNNVMDSVLSEVVLLDSSYSWQERVRHVCYEWRRIATKYPSFYHFMVFHRMNTPDALKFMNSIMTVFLEAGLDPEKAARYFRAMGYFTMGGAIDEATRFLKGPSSTTAMPDEEVKEKFPIVFDFGLRYTQEEEKKIFDLGVKLFLKGIEGEINSRPTE